MSTSAGCPSALDVLRKSWILQLSMELILQFKTYTLLYQTYQNNPALLKWINKMLLLFEEAHTVLIDENVSASEVSAVVKLIAFAKNPEGYINDDEDMDQCECVNEC